MIICETLPLPLSPPFPNPKFRVSGSEGNKDIRNLPTGLQDGSLKLSFEPMEMVPNVTTHLLQ